MLNNNNKPIIMGILNITPDSFSDGGQYTQITAAVARAKTMITDGVDIIDIGGESTRPGAESVSADEQIRRVVPIILAIRKQLSTTIKISIDTTLSTVAQAALDVGANIINDISAAQNDPQMLALARQKKVAIILMHMQGTPKTMQDNPYYVDVVATVIDFLKNRADAARQAGIKKQNIILDPGIGFGKSKQDNINLLAHLNKIVQLGFPVLLGASRKRFMHGFGNVSQPSELVTATATTTALAIMAGVRLLRVHDVLENRQAADIAWAIHTSR